MINKIKRGYEKFKENNPYDAEKEDKPYGLCGAIFLIITGGVLPIIWRQLRTHHYALAVVTCSVALFIAIVFWYGILGFGDHGLSTTEVPDLVEMRQSDAEGILNAAGITYRLVPTDSSERRGIVVATDPEAHAGIDESVMVIVHVSTGVSRPYTMPGLKGHTVASAKRVLSRFHLRFKVEEVKSLEKAGTIISTYPALGAKVYSGDEILLRISKGS